MSDPSDSRNSQPFVEHLKQLDDRIARIEQHLGLSAPPATGVTSPPRLLEHAPSAAAQDEDGLEFQIGQFLVAQVGIVVLVIGLAFLLTLPFARMPAGLLPAIGFLLTGAMIALAHLTRRSFAYIARCLLAGGLFLLYFSILRLHFFAAQPLLAARWLEAALLSLAVIATLGATLRERSAGLAALAITLGFVTALISEQSWFLLPAVLLLAALSAVFSVKLRWEMLLLYAIFLAYVTHAFWIINNPIMSGEFRLLHPSKIHLISVLACWLIFAAAGLFREKENESLWDDEIEITQALMNAFLGYGLYILVSFTAYRTPTSTPHLLASAVLLALASAFWIRRKSRYATFIYAMFGYAALTLAIILETARPAVFVWLCWQSMLVLATALWFRSKFIVCGNFAIFVGVLLAYLAFDRQTGSVGLHFALVSLLSARVLNWQKNRLELQTELMRNAYLAVAFLIVPYALWRLLPSEYVALAWLAAGVVYYALSIAIRNRKYRWMALLTLLLTVVYVFVIGIARLEPVYRVISFIALGIALLVVSLVYTGIRARRAAARPAEELES